MFFKINFIKRFAVLLVFLFLIISCETPRVASPMDMQASNLIPWPASLEATGSSFLLDENTEIYYDTLNIKLKELAQLWANQLKPATGFDLKLLPAKKVPEKGSIYLKLTNSIQIKGQEGYRLTITEDQVKVEIKQPEGAFRALQTFRQLLPAAIESSSKQNRKWELPTGIINDHPDLNYRGAMLDVARHFFSVEDVKQFIDHMVTYKMNVLHLHLTDDQGWRIQINSWPNLTKHGGQTEVGATEGGFYTQAQYSDIIKYAAQRYILVIPEIDMPGHTNAALASYPELNCNNKAPELYTGTEVGFSSLCIDKELTYNFVDDVIRELASITPGPYIHIGGDESHSTKKKDFIKFINRTQKIVNKYGKEMIGWDEISQASLKPGSITQFWAKEENAMAAVTQNSKVLMSPAKKAYLDMQYDENSPLGLHWAAYIEVDDGYNWDPATYVKGLNKENILGIEAPLWSETVKTMDDIEYMLFPRLPGYAEIGWTRSELRNWEDYKVRLANQKERFEHLNINYYKSPKVPWPKDSTQQIKREKT